MKSLMIKVIRSTIYLTAFTTCPAILMCVICRLGLPANRFTLSCTLFGGAAIAFLFEPPTRHIQLLSYMLPKVVQTVASVLERRGKYHPRSWHSKLALCLALIVISLACLHAQLLSHKQNTKIQKDGQAKNEKVRDKKVNLYNDILGNLINL